MKCAARNGHDDSAPTGAAASVLIIGFGNALRGDDGLGPAAARRLARTYAACPAVQVLECHQLLPELAEPVSRADLLVLIDACQDAPPGHINCRQLDVEPAGAPGARPFNHDLDPAALLNMSHRLFGSAPRRTFVCTVGGAEFGFVDRLSPSAEAALDELVRRVQDVVSWWTGRQPAPVRPRRTRRERRHA
jgi:hydrogenase maturation protease